MSLSEHVKNHFDARVRARGAEYFHAGRVRIKKHDQEHFVVASVRGSRAYEVMLDRAPGELDISCDCPYFLDNDECKHVWATILAADQRGLLQPTEKETEIEVVPILDDVDLEPPDEFPPDLFEAGAYPEVFRKKIFNPVEPDWRMLLSQIPEDRQVRRPQVWPESREVFYCIDPARTLGDGNIHIEIMSRQQKKKGGWTTLKPLGLSPDDIAALPRPEDRQILLTLRGANRPYGMYYNKDAYFSIPRGMTEFVLPLICSTGRFIYSPNRGEPSLSPITLDPGAPWRFLMKVNRQADDGDYAISGELERDGDIQPLSGAVLLLYSGWVFWKDRVARLDHSNAFEWIVLLRKKCIIRVPEKEIGDLPAVLYGRQKLPPIVLPEEIQCAETVGVPKFKLTIRKPSHHVYPQDAMTGRLSVEYDDIEVAAGQSGDTIFLKDTRVVIRRDTAAEQNAIKQLDSMGLPRWTYAEPGALSWTVRQGQLPMVVSTLMGIGWAVQAEGRTFRNAGTFDMEVSSGIDWFDLRAKVDFDGITADLPSLLKAIQNKEHFVSLDDGTVGILPEDWLRRYGVIAKMGKIEDDTIRFHRYQAGLLDALLAAQSDVTCDEPFARVRAELKTFDSIKPVAAPAGFVGELRDYQTEGLGWLEFLRRFGFGGCLADDMGLGKTVQVLAMFEARRAEMAAGKAGRNDLSAPSLIVVPRSLVFNWIQEAARFTPQLRILDHTHPEREREAPDFSDYDLVLVTYGVLCRDILHLKAILFDYVVLDEAQAIKNSRAQVAKAARLLRSRNRLVMSGTPVQNHLGELWSLFEFLNPGMLGAASVFNAADGLGRNPSPETRGLLAQALRPFILRRTKGQVAKELPERTEETLYCELEGKQRKLYDELRAHYQSVLLDKVARIGMGKSKIMIIEALLRLRQAACHPGLIDKRRAPDPCAKLDALMPQLVEVLEEGHKALVFSQFTSFLEIVQKQLKARSIPYEYLDGQTIDRQGPVERFQNDPDCNLFLISLKAGGLGLNLTAAEYVFLLDPWWNPAIEAQAIDRAHRIGQSCKVFAYRLIARDTVEEKVLELQKTKKELADSIINADNSLIRSLTKEDLKLLLG